MEPVSGERKSICFVSLGCHKNQVDAEVILGSLDNHGFEMTPEPESADYIIVNTCGFIEPARNESVEMLLEMDELRKQGARLVVAGCMADRDRALLEKMVPGIDLYASSFNLDSIPKLLIHAETSPQPMSPEQFRWADSPRWLMSPPSYAYVKISDGCDNRCNYCRIPYLRGPFRSRPMEICIEEVKDIISTGRREIILISQDSTSWGSDLSGYFGFTDLVREISELDDLKRLRIMYAYPADFDMDLLELMAERDTICSYLDIPLQHTDPGMLRAMNRRLPGFSGKASQSAVDFFSEIRKRVPDITIRTTLMTGFPGETDEIFQDMLEFVESGQVDHLGVFSWSQEPDTPCADMSDDGDIRVAEERASALTMIQAEVVEERNSRRLGQIMEVVIDEQLTEDTTEKVLARLESQAPEIDGHVEVEGSYDPGDYLAVELTGLDLFDFKARPTVFGMDSAPSKSG